MVRLRMSFDRIVKNLMVQSPASSAPRAVATPCVQVCVVDGPSGLCLGCFRTLPEIAGWSKLTDDRRAQIMTELPSRRGRIDPTKLGG